MTGTEPVRASGQAGDTAEPGHGHGHGHFHDEDLDWKELGPQLERGAEVTAAWTDQAVAWLRERPAAVRRVLDIGSGPGVTACRLAQAFTDAEVVAVDGEPALLDRVTDRAARLGLASRVRTQEADIAADLSPVGTADVIWTSHVLHHLGDQRDGVARLAALLRPGGVLAIAEGGLPNRFLPRDLGFGRPALESRLDALLEDWFTDMRASLPGTVADVDDWPSMLTAAGLESPQTRTFLAEVPAPVDDQAREYVVRAFTRSRDLLAHRLDEDDRESLDRLLDPDAPDGLHRRQDIRVLTARTLHTARRP